MCRILSSKFIKLIFGIFFLFLAPKLVKASEVEITADYTTEYAVPFDSVNFDRVGFGTSTSFATTKDYVVISKASPDRNPWSRHNRWIHKSVIEASAKANGQIANVDQSLRARRPIIEFEAGLKLYNFGTSSKGNINLIDTVTTDAMSDVEGAVGYHIDGVELTNGMKVMFTADTDPLVKNKIYEWILTIIKLSWFKFNIIQYFSVC